MKSLFTAQKYRYIENSVTETMKSAHSYEMLEAVLGTMNADSSFCFARKDIARPSRIVGCDYSQTCKKPPKLAAHRRAAGKAVVAPLDKPRAL